MGSNAPRPELIERVLPRSVPDRAHAKPTGPAERMGSRPKPPEAVARLSASLEPGRSSVHSCSSGPERAQHKTDFMIFGRCLFFAYPLETGFSFEIATKSSFSAQDSITTDQAAINAFFRVSTVTGRSVEGEREMANAGRTGGPSVTNIRIRVTRRVTDGHGSRSHPRYMPRSCLPWRKTIRGVRPP